MRDDIGGVPVDTSNGPGNPIWEDNMRRMKELGKRSSLETTMADMVSSDEELQTVRTALKPRDEEVDVSMVKETLIYS